MSKHTAGPWEVRKDENQAFVSARHTTSAPLWAGDGPSQPCESIKDVAVVCKLRMGTDEREANAHLIAAAPEMYEALKSVWLMFTDGHAISRFDWSKSFLRAEDIQELNEIPLAIRAAIAKAEGR